MQEKVFDFLGNIQISVFCRVISTGNRPLFSAIVSFGSELRWLSSSRGVLGLVLLLLVGDDVFFFSRVNFVSVALVDFEGHVEVLVFNLVVLSLRARSCFVSLTRRLVVIVGVGALLVVLLVIAVIRELVLVDLERVSSRLGKILLCRHEFKFFN